ncbi:hypothetical protein [Butyrivibrio sp. FCS014]|uniref:hypothetical protein n=1 Tax=Butyrivibrio sp. FCS014 TaxID=1408304 RepID=UPI0004631EC6|nr:hypothetical protein [Butyrivibrio sp. FCS014]
MKSDIMVIGTNQDFTKKALDFTEQYAGNLPKKAHLRIRLVAEELMNLFRSITGEMEAEYWIENESNIFTLHLDTETIMFAKKRQELMELSSTKENAAAKGVIGKIREAFELALLPMDEREAMLSRYSFFGFTSADSMNSTPEDVWRMSDYIAEVNKSDDTEFVQEAKDELEKSIIANLAKDVTISIRGDKVSMAVVFDGHIS